MEPEVFKADAKQLRSRLKATEIAVAEFVLPELQQHRKILHEILRKLPESENLCEFQTWLLTKIEDSTLTPQKHDANMGFLKVWEKALNKTKKYRKRDEAWPSKVYTREAVSEQEVLLQQQEQENRALRTQIKALRRKADLLAAREEELDALRQRLQKMEIVTSRVETLEEEVVRARARASRFAREAKHAKEKQFQEAQNRDAAERQVSELQLTVAKLHNTLDTESKSSKLEPSSNSKGPVTRRSEAFSEASPMLSHSKLRRTAKEAIAQALQEKIDDDSQPPRLNLGDRDAASRNQRPDIAPHEGECDCEDAPAERDNEYRDQHSHPMGDWVEIHVYKSNSNQSNGRKQQG